MALAWPITVSYTPRRSLATEARSASLRVSLAAWIISVLALAMASLTLFSTLSSWDRALRALIRESVYCWVTDMDCATCTAREAAWGSSEGLTTLRPVAICWPTLMNSPCC